MLDELPLYIPGKFPKCVGPADTIKRSQFLLFNTMRVHRGPCNVTSDWQIVLFMTWPMELQATVTRLKKMEAKKKNEELGGRSPRLYDCKAIWSIITQTY